MNVKEKPLIFFDVVRGPDPTRWVWIIRRGMTGPLIAISPRSWKRETAALRAMHEIVDGAVRYADDEVPF